MIRASAVVLLFALPLGACAVSGAGVTSSGVAVNQCSSDSECPGGVTGSCKDQMCQGSHGTLTNLLVAVTPPPTLVGINSFTTFPDLSKSGALGSAGGRLDLELDQVVSVSGTLRIDTTACSPLWSHDDGGSTETSADGTIPGAATFTPSQRALGIATDSYSTFLDPKGYAFVATVPVPAGEYDVYLKPYYPVNPMMSGDPACQVPPHLVLRQTIASTLDFKFPPASTLPINITWPLAQAYVAGAEQIDPFLANPLLGWTVDLIDQSSGRVLSTVQTLTAPVPPVGSATSVTYPVTLVYSPVYVPVKGMLQPFKPGSELIRLTPPPTDPRFTTAAVPLTAPTIFAQLDGALVDPDGKPAPAQIVQTTPLPPPVTVQFQTALEDGTPMPGGVALTAETLDGVTGLSTSFSRSIQVDSDGLGAVDLLPGRYRVIASPKGGCTDGACLALVVTEWDVSAQPPVQSGKVITFQQAQRFFGSAKIGGRAVAGAGVRAVSSYAPPNVLDAGNASGAIVPRAASGIVDINGGFSFEADTGTFDVRVEPDPSTGYGWLVMPGLALPDQSDALSDLVLDLPILYRGTVTGVDSSGNTIPIPKALIRAFVYVKDGAVTTKTDATAAVQVAETYSAGEGANAGAFTLLVPKVLTPPSP